MTRTAGAWTAVLLATVAIGCSGAPELVIEQRMDALRLAADLRVQLTKASDAANRAVMADTDEGSVAFVREADQAKQAIQADVNALTPKLASLRYAGETQILNEFNQRFAEYQTLDRTILELAVENTNLKAQRLSFGPALEAADVFRDALKSLPPAVPSSASRLDALTANAIASVREIQALEAPHIAESDDAAMTRLETRMNLAEASAREALKSVAAVIQPASRPKLDAATASLDQFMAVNAQILTLSRRNSNVRSLALSLGQKRTLAAACEERLQALQDALSKRDIGATR